MLNTRKNVAVIVLLSCLAFSNLQSVYATTTTYYVDVFGVIDAEAWPNYWMQLWLLNISVNMYYQAYSVVFRISHWRYWNSPDTSDAYAMLYSAIEYWNWEWGKDGTYELMIVITGKSIDPLGLSLDFERALIIKDMTGSLYSLTVLLHEIGHQFTGPGHCSHHWCFMNPTAVYLKMATEYCPHCSNLINENKQNIVYNPPPPPPPDPPPGGGGGCPTLFAWNGTAYVDYGVIDIHNPTGEDVIREVLVLAEDVNINNYKATFRLREGWAGLNFSESLVDQLKLYAVDNRGRLYLCPLVNATHSKLGNVLPQLLFSDNHKAQILLLETIDLTFVVPYQSIQSFIFVIEGCNIEKLPY